MADYISRDDTKNALLNKGQHTTRYRLGETWELNFMEILEALDAIPAADVQPVRHGRWLSHHAIWIDQPKIEGWFVQAKCSECKKWAHVMNPYTKSVDYECCPHCGAKMIKDGEQK